MLNKALVEQLDRQHERLRGRDGPSFFPELKRYRELLLGDATASAVVAGLKCEAEGKESAFGRHDAELQPELISLKDELLNRAPECADPPDLRPEGLAAPRWDWSHSFANFDLLAEGSPEAIHARDGYDTSVSGQMLRVLQDRLRGLQWYEGDTAGPVLRPSKRNLRPELDDLVRRLGNLADRHRHAKSKYEHAIASDGGFALVELDVFFESMNPPPREIGSEEDQHAWMNESFKRAVSGLYLVEAALRPPSEHHFDDRQLRTLDYLVEKAKSAAERLHEDLRARLLGGTEPAAKGDGQSRYGDGAMEERPSVFISYAHADRELAQAIARGLEERGLKVWVDENELLPGDSIIEQISTAVAGVDFFCALVSTASRESNWCRKELSLAVTQGLGREGATVIPVRVGHVEMPESLVDLLYVRVDPDDPAQAIERIAVGVQGHRQRKERLGDRAVTQETPTETSEPVGPDAEPPVSESTGPAPSRAADAFEPIRIVGVVKEGVGERADDGTRGSALYRIPLRLSREPSAEWAELFKATWDRPPSFTTMHRPGIGYVEGDTIVLDGTDMHELEQYHVPTLRLVLDKVNAEVAALEAEKRARAEAETARQRDHRHEVDDIADRLDFE